MSLQNADLPTFNTVAKNQDAIVIVPGGRTVHACYFEISDDTGATLNSGNLGGDIQILLGTKVQRQLSLLQLNHIQSLFDPDNSARTYGVANNPGYQTHVPMYFADPSRKNPYQGRASAWPLTGKFNGMQIKLRLGNLTNPVLTGYYEYEENANPAQPTKKEIFDDSTLIVKYYRESIPCVGTIIEKIALSNLAGRANSYLLGIHFFPTPNGKYIDTLNKLSKNGRRYRDNWSYKRNQVTLLNRGLNPDVNATPVFDCVLDYDDPVDTWLPLEDASELSFKATLNAATAENMDVVYIVAGPPD